MHWATGDTIDIKLNVLSISGMITDENLQNGLGLLGVSSANTTDSLNDIRDETIANTTDIGALDA